MDPATIDAQIAALEAEAKQVEHNPYRARNWYDKVLAIKDQIRRLRDRKRGVAWVPVERV